MPKKTKKESSDEIVLSLDQLAIPGAIILAGVIIAVAVFFANKKDADSVDTSGTENAAEQENTPEDSDSEFPDTTTDLGSAPYIGDKAKAKVAVIEYNEYNCSYCLRHKNETLPSIVKDYIDAGKVIYVFREFPIYGDDGANAAKCVYHLTDIDTYQEFHNGAFEYESTDDLYALAKEVGVNEKDFDSCFTSKKYQSEVDADMKAGQDAGVQGTPGFVIGVFDKDGNVTGKLVPGAYPYESFAELIESFL